MLASRYARNNLARFAGGGAGGGVGRLVRQGRAQCLGNFCRGAVLRPYPALALKPGHLRSQDMHTFFKLASVASVLVLAACAAGDPPGTAATRGVDRAAGTNNSGAYPAQRDGTAANPTGTAAERAVDRAAGTNNSGAFPQQSDGTPGNPRGTAAGRAIGDRR
jgi:hypothetical protein